MTSMLPVGTPVDLDDGEREPIHIPGAVQPHPRAVLGTTLGTLFAPEHVVTLESAVLADATLLLVVRS